MGTIAPGLDGRSRGRSANYAGLRRSGGAPSRIRTCDLRIRSPTLYPTELWARPTPREEWRRGRDSNPGPGSTPGNRLAGGCLRPTRPPLRAQRPSSRGAPPLSTRPVTCGWVAEGEGFEPPRACALPVFKTGSGCHPRRSPPTNPKSFLPIGYYAFGAVLGVSAGVPAQNPHTRGPSGDRRPRGDRRPVNYVDLLAPGGGIEPPRACAHKILSWAPAGIEPVRSGPCRAGPPRARVRPPWECARWADAKGPG